MRLFFYDKNTQSEAVLFIQITVYLVAEQHLYDGALVV
jgi:hypothetical protein